MGFLDSRQIGSWHQVEDENKWDKYNDGNQQVFIALWIMVFVSGALVYWLFSRDLSESIGFLLAGIIMLFTGLLDVFFFWFSKYQMTSNMCWFNTYGSPIGWFSETFFKHDCVLQLDLYILTIIGILFSYGVFRILFMFRIKK